MAKSESTPSSHSGQGTSFPKIKPSNVADGDLNAYSLEKFRLYETRQRYYLIGSDRNKHFYRVLKIDRSEPSDLNVSQDPMIYSPTEVKNLLQRISEGNRAIGGLNFVAKVYGIAGCIKFLESYYLILVTKHQQIGCICGHPIYSIDESQLIAIPHSSIQTDVAHSKAELRYKKLLSSVDLTKDFFYSYTYPIMQSLQKNVTSMGEETMPYDSMFVWNSYLTRPIRSKCGNTIWTIALVHGYFKQIRLSVFGRDFSVTLISRRSRHFAGTRFLKRGVNDRGRVANDVETEQIVLDELVCKGKMSSVVQMRGSIPLFWSQETSKFSPKPDIILHRYDPTYEATKLHFENLANRYGCPIIVLNLIKTVEKRPREMMLRREFTNAVGYLNTIFQQENYIEFIHWDFHKFAKSKSANVLAVLGGVAKDALDMTGFFYSKLGIVKRRNDQFMKTNTSRVLPLEGFIGLEHASGHNGHGDGFVQGQYFQCGVLRTNCIDCLDRTNVAQYAYGLAALGRQLHAIGLLGTLEVDPRSTIAAALMDMYQCMGDALAHQYGGSAAHNTVFPERQGKWKATTQSKEFMKSIRRYYSNTYTDGEKQDAMNLFLGYFQPQEGKPALWDLDSDYHLHVHGSREDFCTDSCTLLSNTEPVRTGMILAPIPALREDFSRVKLTSFDKLIEKTCSRLKNVRFWCEPSERLTGAGSCGVAPDAAVIQLRSPNWLFGHRKLERSGHVGKPTPPLESNSVETNEGNAVDFCCSRWLSSIGVVNGESTLQSYHAESSVHSANDWYDGILLGDQDESSEVFKYYSEMCQGFVMDPFKIDPEKEKHYEEILRKNMIGDGDNIVLEAEMELAVTKANQISADLGILPRSSRSFVSDPCWLTRVIIGLEMAAAA